MPKHWANAIVLECDLPAPEVQVRACTQKKRLQEGVLTRRLWQVTASKCSRSPAQTALLLLKHGLIPPAISQSGTAVLQLRLGIACAVPTTLPATVDPGHHGKQLAREGIDNSPHQCLTCSSCWLSNSTGTVTNCCCYNRTLSRHNSSFPLGTLTQTASKNPSTAERRRSSSHARFTIQTSC